MNTHLLASAFGRWLAPVLLAATVVAGSLGFSSVASAQERGRGAGPHAFVHGPGRFAPGPYVGPYRHGYVPGWRRPGFGGRAWGPGWGGRGFHGGGFHGGGRGGGFHGGGHGGGHGR